MFTNCSASAGIPTSNSSAADPHTECCSMLVQCAHMTQRFLSRYEYDSRFSQAEDAKQKES